MLYYVSLNYTLCVQAEAEPECVQMSKVHGGGGMRSHARSASHGGIMLTRDAGKGLIHSLVASV